MAIATIIRFWRDQGRVYLAVAVPGDAVVNGSPAALEYIASTSFLDAAGNPRTIADLKADLVGQVKAQRDEKQNGPADLGTGGTVQV